MNDFRPTTHGGSSYAEGLAQGVVRYQHCVACGAPLTLTRAVCPVCGGQDLAWSDASGTGTVYAVTMIHRAPSDEFRPMVPYTLVLVDLDEGSRVMAHGTPGLAIGERVSARILPHAGRHLLAFEPGRIR